MIDTELVPREVPGYRSTRMEFGDLFGHAIGFKLLENGKWGGGVCLGGSVGSASNSWFCARS